jgi:hypothetical protein
MSIKIYYSVAHRVACYPPLSTVILADERKVDRITLALTAAGYYVTLMPTEVKSE